MAHDRLNHARQRKARQKLRPKLLKHQMQTSEELVEAKNNVVLLAKVTAVTRLTPGWHEGVKMTPHISELTVEGVNSGVMLSNGASKLQGGEVESMAGGVSSHAPISSEWKARRQDP
jgi:hypothetical protein